jgi:Gram-negative bacterial TonB protein C-terminal
VGTASRLDCIVMLESENTTLTMFRARPPIPSGAAVAPPLRPTPQARSPRLAVKWEGSDWWTSLQAISTRVNLGPWRETVRLFRETPVAPFRFSGGSLSLSLIFHIGFVLLLPILLAYRGSDEATAYAAYEEPQRIIYYDIPKHDPLEKLPKILPTGAGAQPGAGDLAALMQKLGSTKAARKVIIVSKPIHPDNNHQTIYQPATPPDLRINMDLKLPNIVGGATPNVPKPQVHFNPSISKPMQVRHTVTKATAPTLAATNAALPTSLPDATVARPRLAVPVDANSRPIQGRMVIGQATAPSLTQTEVATANNLGDSYRAGAPAAPSGPGWDAGSYASGHPSKNNSVNTVGDGSGTVVISVDPGEAAALASLPPGNKWGDFTIAPGPGQPGAVGGSEEGFPGAGSSLKGAGGDRSTGIGRGDLGGGGGNNGTNGVVSINGDVGGAGNALDATIFREMVYPVPANVVLRKNTMVVSAGPMGGGGLDVYGALRCGKIYTIFLPMPGRAWTLQYCPSGAAAKPPAPASTSVVRMEAGIVPPDVQARFDFKRLPVPFEKKNKPIVLKGVLKEDGTITDLEVYQGIVPEMDEAARVAFKAFKFKPALRDNKPISIDILVGIPTETVVTTRAQ